MIKRLAGCIREYKKPSIITILLIVAEAVIESAIPFITADMVNRIKDGADIRQIVQMGIILVVLACLSLACGGVAGFTCAKASAGFAKNLRHDLFDSIQTFSFQNIDRFSPSSLVTRMTTDVANVQMSYMMIIRLAIRCPLMFLFSIIMAYIMGGALATSFVVIIPVLGVGLYAITRKAMPAFHRVFRKYDRLNESIEENVRGMRVVKGFSRESFEIEKFNRAADDICRDFTKAERLVALDKPLMQICIYFNMAFVLLVGSKLTISSNGVLLDVGQISAMLTYGFQIMMSLMLVMMVYIILTISAESFKRICEVLGETSTLTSPDHPVTAVQNGDVDFHHVSFRYTADAKNDVLHDVDLHIRSGMTVGILGLTGTSKSSLVQLIPRLYDVTAGSVAVAGVDVRDYDITALRSAVAMVLQKNLLFSGTIKDNLRWGNPDATDEELEAACRLAQADEFIRSFPDGYDTWIEQGGTNVSGGQKQRLCIARALLKKPKILILDDSTSAVDMKTDALIRAGFMTYIPETTKIIIAQRVASVQDADMIVVMNNGGIAAAGNHDTLLGTCSLYREIFGQQTNVRDTDGQE